MELRCGHWKNDIHERIQLKFLKYILFFILKKSTPTYMIYGELGIIPIAVEIKSPMLNFWCNLTEAVENPNLYALLYKAIYIIFKSEWLAKVEICLNLERGFSGIWQSQACQTAYDLKSIKAKIK